MTVADDILTGLVASGVAIKGEKGDRGPIGHDGPPGRKGDKGDRGPKGDLGPAGRDGGDGKDGANGKDGTDGLDGIGPDEKIKIKASDPVAGFLEDKLEAGRGINLIQRGGALGERIIIEAQGTSAGIVAGGRGPAGPPGPPGPGGGDQTAAEVPFTPAGTIAATNVQDAIEEVAAEAGGGTLADTLTAGNETDGTAIVANVPDDFEDVLYVPTGDTGNLTGNAYVIRIRDIVNGHHTFDLDAWGSILINGPADPSDGTGGLHLTQNGFATIVDVNTNGRLILRGIQTTSEIRVDNVLHVMGTGFIGFFDKEATGAAQQTIDAPNATPEQIANILIAYGLAVQAP